MAQKNSYLEEWFTAEIARVDEKVTAVKELMFEKFESSKLALDLARSEAQRDVDLARAEALRSRQQLNWAIGVVITAALAILTLLITFYRR